MGKLFVCRAPTLTQSRQTVVFLLFFFCFSAFRVVFLCVVYEPSACLSGVLVVPPRRVPGLERSAAPPHAEAVQRRRPSLSRRLDADAGRRRGRRQDE